VEGDPDRSREVQLPVMPEDHPAARTLPRHCAGARRGKPAGDDPLRQVRAASASQPTKRGLRP
jgi:hypothetical protein